MSRGRSSRFRRLGDVLPQVVRKLRLDAVAAAQPAVNDWPVIVGARIAAHTRAVSIERGVLLVVADSPAWMTQLAYLKPQLLRKLSARVGRDRVTDIRFIPGRPGGRGSA